MKPGPKAQARPPCRVPGCGRPSKVKARALCCRHYLRFQRYGDPEAPRRKGDPWTAREDELVRSLPTYERNGRAKLGAVVQLAEELGRSRNAVGTRRHVLRWQEAAARIAP